MAPEFRCEGVDAQRLGSRSESLEEPHVRSLTQELQKPPLVVSHGCKRNLPAHSSPNPYR
jgi:hypothetical protein